MDHFLSDLEYFKSPVQFLDTVFMSYNYLEFPGSEEEVTVVIY